MIAQVGSMLVILTGLFLLPLTVGSHQIAPVARGRWVWLWFGFLTLLPVGALSLGALLLFGLILS